jgi:hypothetical protein
MQSDLAHLRNGLMAQYEKVDEFMRGRGVGRQEASAGPRREIDGEKGGDESVRHDGDQ